MLLQALYQCFLSQAARVSSLFTPPKGYYLGNALAKCLAGLWINQGAVSSCAGRVSPTSKMLHLVRWTLGISVPRQQSQFEAKEVPRESVSRGHFCQGKGFQSRMEWRTSHWPTKGKEANRASGLMSWSLSCKYISSSAVEAVLQLKLSRRMQRVDHGAKVLENTHPIPRKTNHVSWDGIPCVQVLFKLFPHLFTHCLVDICWFYPSNSQRWLTSPW